MADNYLEKRMEEYRAGKLAPKSQRHAAGAAVRKPGDLTLSFPQMNALVLADDAGWAGAVCRAFRKADFRVAFCLTDSRNGNRIAQTSGCRFYPHDPSDSLRLCVTLDDLVERWGGIDVVVDLRGLGQDDYDDAVRIAPLLLVHSHPDFSFVVSTEANL